MPYELFIALRYLRARRRQTTLSVITAIAVIGITAGVAALIIAQALATGFRSDIQRKILQGTAHLNLLREDNSGIENYRQLIEQAKRIPGVRAASATTYTNALVSVGSTQEQAILKGVDMQAPREANEIHTTLEEGEVSQLEPPRAPNEEEPEEAAPAAGIILGRHLARALGVRVNDLVTATSVATRLTPAGLQPRPRYTTFRVAGVFSSGLYEYDAKWAYISLPAAQRLIGEEDTAGVIQMQVEDIYAVAEIGARVRAMAGGGFITTNWQELNRPLFAALQLQHRVVLVFFGLLIVIASLNIITTLTMMVIEKHRDIAILRAQGATPPSIRRIFILQGLIIGLLGAVSGALLGILACLVANRYKLISMPAEIYSISHITLKTTPLDALVVSLFALMICFLATLLPSRAASRVSPVEGLRYE
ncbi:MAG: ABC transporter permease [Blastocatellia bacterium]|nr:ABC transporter permease [Blastocatellia bacterium]